MGRRRRTKVQTRPKPKIPDIFDCPICSKKAVAVVFNKDQNVFDIECTNCGKNYRFSNPTRIQVKFGCPNCNEKDVTIEFIESTNSIRIYCTSCGKSTFDTAQQWENDPETFSKVRFVPGGSKLGCPNCGFRTLNISVKLRKEYASIQCGACGVKDVYPVTSLDEKVDVYGQFVDTIRSNIRVMERLGPEALPPPVQKAPPVIAEDTTAASSLKSKIDSFFEPEEEEGEEEEESLFEEEEETEAEEEEEESLFKEADEKEDEEEEEEDFF